jgi:acyl-coenzyme A synthetase/AMP-(fatty) acid ligase
MAHFMVPRKVVFVQELPKNATGKVQKLALRERARGLRPRAADKKRPDPSRPATMTAVSKL